MKRFVFMSCAVLLFAACVKEAENIPTEPVTGEEIQVKLNWSVAGMVAGDEMTRAAAAEGRNSSSTRVIPSDMGPGGIYDDNYPTIQNIWIIQFDGNTPAARMLGAPRFLSVMDGDLTMSDPQNSSYPKEVYLPLVQVSSPCYTLFVANIRQGSTYNWNLTTESTFSDVITRVKTIQTESGAFEDFTALGPFPDGSQTLLMSAVTTTPVVAATPLEPVFSRNVAKITLNLSLNNADMSIASVRIRNVSNSIVFADAALAHNGVTATSVFPVNASLLDYDPITNAAVMPVSGDPAVTFSWYVPRNQQGVRAGSSSVKDKTFLAPANATFIEIVAVKSGSGGSTSVFRVYPGADMVSDYNLISNHEYTVGLNVVDIGTDPADSRVQTFSNVVDYSGYGTPGAASNSFIINPAPAAAGANRTYLIGVHQVNRFWGGSSEGYGNLSTNVISASESWVVSLIWSDLPELFSSTPSATAITLLNNNGTGVGTGTGPDQAFALNIPPNLPAGNFVLGVKKVGPDNRYLWSWHFWVTDYSPDNFNRLLIDHNVYTYSVPGGQVERYAPGISGANYDMLWTTTGLYADKVMMDRNLGTVENLPSKSYANNSRGILYYQFGRKDPLPANIPLTSSEHSGFTPPATGIPIVTTETGVPITMSVDTPWAFYAVNGNWTTQAQKVDYLWNDPNVPNFAAGKSIYDPCPPGWKLPMWGTWSDFLRKDVDIPSASITIANQGRDLGWLFGRGIGTVDVPVNGTRYWPGETLDAPVGGRIWYPAMGYRNTGGAISSPGVTVSLRASTPANNPTQTNIMSGGATGASTYGNNARANATPMRCISE